MVIAQIRKALDYYRQGGWYEVALRLSQRALLPSWVFLLDEDVILMLDRLNERALARATAGYEYAEADRSVLDELIEFSPAKERELLHGVFTRFFRDGARCFTVRQGGLMAGYMWAFEKKYILTYDNYRRRNLVVALADDSVFVGNGLIGGNHRLKGLFQHLLAFIIAQWPQGTHFFSAVARTNDLSLRSHLRLGFVEHVGILCVSLFSITRYFRCDTAEERKRILPEREPLML